MLPEFMHWLGFGLCHQAPDRSFFGGGLQVPVCARDTGIYVGFVVSFTAVALLHRPQRPREFPRPAVWAVLAGLVALMGWDGVTSYAGLRETTNAIRLFTGLGAGFAAAVVTYPMLQDELWLRSDAFPVLDPPWRAGVWLGLLPASFAVVLWAAPWLGIFYPVLVAASIVITLTLVNLIIVSMLPAFDRQGTRVRDLWASVLIALGFTIVEIAVSDYVRLLLLRIVIGT